jgi:signal transduction histidine kinase
MPTALCRHQFVRQCLPMALSLTALSWTDSARAASRQNEQHVPSADVRVTAGTPVRYREASDGDRYGKYMLGTVAIVLAQSSLIALLLVQARRRRQAQEQVRGGQARLRASYQRIRDLGGRLLLAQEHERSRIARELHDDIGQKLALLVVDLELIGSAGPDLEWEIGTLIRETLARARDVAKSVHDLSHRLHPEKLRLLGLVAALSGLQREFSTANLKLTFTHHNVPAPLPHDVTLCLFRVAQEALQNIVTHSAAHEISVQLIGSTSGLVLTIVDDGTGFDSDAVKNKGLGLISMSERLDPIGGSLKIWTRPGEGTRIEIAVPHERLAATSA